METQANANVLDDLTTIEDLAENHSRILSESTIRWQLRFRDRNGLDSCVVTVGKKMLISKSRYEAWLTRQIGATK